MRVAVFITVRLGSTRLPNKALLEIMNKSTIEHLIERVKTAKNVDLIVICTTTNSEDEKLAEVAQRNEIKSFRGDEKDILKRHYDAAKFYEVDFVINVDGDDIFCDPGYIDLVAKAAKENSEEYDVIETKGLDFGINCFGYKVSCLEDIVNKKEEKDTDTGWGEFFRDNTHLKKRQIIAPPEHQSNARMSLDYEEDLQFFTRVITELFKPEEYYSLDDIIQFLKNNPEVIEINKKVEEKYWENYSKKKVLKNKED